MMNKSHVSLIAAIWIGIAALLFVALSATRQVLDLRIGSPDVFGPP